MTRLLGVPWSAPRGLRFGRAASIVDVLPVGYAADAVASCRRRGCGARREAGAPRPPPPPRVESYEQSSSEVGRGTRCRYASARGVTAAEFGRAVAEQVGRVIVGKADQTRLLIVALLADGHVLLDDVPGVAKTLLVRTLSAAPRPQLLAHPVHARPAAGRRHRLAGLRPEAGEFEFRPGPLFANVVLADEINRATPAHAVGVPRGDGGARRHGRRHDARAAAAVHGAGDAEPGRAEGDVPAARGAGRPLPALPAHGVPERRRTRRSCSSGSAAADPLAEVRAVVGADDLRAVRAAVREVHVSADVAGYIVALARATRESPLLQARREPARLARAAARGAGRRGARRARLRDARRRPGARSRRSWRTGCCSPATPSSTGARRRTSCGEVVGRACRCRRRPKGTRRPRREPEALVRLRSILWACLAGLVGSTLLHSAALAFATLAAAAVAALVIVTRRRLFTRRHVRPDASPAAWSRGAASSRSP